MEAPWWTQRRRGGRAPIGMCKGGGADGELHWWHLDGAAPLDEEQIEEAWTGTPTSDDSGIGAGAALASEARGSGARTLEVGVSDPVENARTRSSIPSPWASKRRGSLALVQFPRGVSTQGKCRDPGEDTGSQTRPNGENGPGVKVHELIYTIDY